MLEGDSWVFYFFSHLLLLLFDKKQGNTYIFLSFIQKKKQGNTSIQKTTKVRKQS